MGDFKAENGRFHKLEAKNGGFGAENLKWGM